MSDPALSPRELDVLAMLAKGCTLKVAATRLGMSNETAKTRANTMRLKLRAKTNTHAVLIAVKAGLL